MGLDATARRRWLGVLVVLTAFAMLIIGETVLEGRLNGLTFLGYWLGCFGFTVLAVLIALWDARVVRRQNRQQQKELLERALKEIEIKRRAKSPGTDKARPESQ